MKKTIISLSAICFLLNSCVEENTTGGPLVNEPNFSIETSESILSSEEMTKTSFSSDMKTVVWEDTDKLSVIAANGEVFTGNMEFSKGAGANEFNGNFTPEAGTTNYYALYPYDPNIGTIKREKAEIPKSRKMLFTSNDKPYAILIDPGTQTGLNNMDHIHVPLWGKGSAEGNARPTVNMTHLAAIFKVTVINPGTEPINVVSVKISNDGSEKMSGKYRISVDAPYPLLPGSETENYAMLKVVNGTIGPQTSGDFYVMTSRVRLNQPTEDTYIHPENLIFEVTTDNDYVVLSIANPTKKPYVFNTGYIHKATVNYTDAIALEKKLDISKTKKIDFKAMKEIPPYLTTALNSDLELRENEGLFIKEGSKAIQLHLNAVPEKFEMLTNGNSKVTINGSTDGKSYTKIKEFARQKNTETTITLTTDEIGQYTSFEIQLGKADMIIREINF